MRDEVKNYISFAWCRFRRSPDPFHRVTCTQSCTQKIGACAINNSLLNGSSGSLASRAENGIADPDQRRSLTQNLAVSDSAHSPQQCPVRGRCTCFASTGPRSNDSFLYFNFLVFPTISGNLLLARSKPRHRNSIGFWHKFENCWGEPLSETQNLRHCFNGSRLAIRPLM
jgi:hypothetical protein